MNRILIAVIALTSLASCDIPSYGKSVYVCKTLSGQTEHHILDNTHKVGDTLYFGARNTARVIINEVHY